MASAMAGLLQRIDRGNRVARFTMRLLLICDGLIGAAWTFGDPNRTQIPVYNQPRRLLSHLDLGFDPARLWGGILLGLAVAGCLAMFGRSEGMTRLIVVLLGGYWVFWFVLDLWAPSQPHGSFTAAPSVGIILLGHVRGAIGNQLLTRRAVDTREA